MAMKRARRRTASSASLAELNARYANDPSGYIRDVFDFGDDHPAPYQFASWDGLAIYRREAVRAGRGAGKGFIAALAALWFAEVWDGVDDWKIVTAASVWRQLTAFLWPEIHKWNRRRKPGAVRPAWSRDRQLFKRALEGETGQAIAVSPGNYETAEGAHASHMLYIFDESKLIERSLWISTMGAMSTGDCYWLALSTPGEEKGVFYDICRGAQGWTGWNVLTVTPQEAIDAGRITQAWVDEMRDSLGEEHPMYRQYVLAEFAELAGGGLIPLSWIERAQARWGEHEGANEQAQKLAAVAADIAGGTGRDETVIARLYVSPAGQRVEIERLTHAIAEHRAYTEWAGRLRGAVKGDRRIPIVVDAVGVGAGVVSILAEQGLNVVPFNGAAKPAASIIDASGQFRYRNWRTAAYFMLRDWLDPGHGAWARAMLPDDRRLAADITAVKIGGILSAGTYALEPKAKLQGELKRSPDAGDVVAMLLAGPVLWAAHLREKGAADTEVIYRPAMADEVMA